MSSGVCVCVFYCRCYQHCIVPVCKCTSAAAASFDDLLPLLFLNGEKYGRDAHQPAKGLQTFWTVCTCFFSHPFFHLCYFFFAAHSLPLFPSDRCQLHLLSFAMTLFIYVCTAYSYSGTGNGSSSNAFLLRCASFARSFKSAHSCASLVAASAVADRQTVV